MATKTTWYCNTNATGSGDGTTPANGYTSLSLLEAAKQKDYVSADEQTDWICSGTTAQTTYTIVSGSTCDATRYIAIIGNRTSYIYDTTKFRIEYTSTCLTVTDLYVRVYNIQCKLTATGDSRAGIKFNPSTSTSVSYVEGCIVVGVLSSTARYNTGIVCNQVASGEHTLYCSNNVIYGFINSTYDAVGFSSSLGWNVYLYDNTFADNYYGIVVNSGACTAKGNISIATFDAFYGTFEAGSDYNVSSDGVATGGVHDRVSQTVTFQDAANRDYRLASNDAGAKGYGVDLDSDAYYPITVDIIGYTRPSSNIDIGAFQTQTADGTANLLYGLLEGQLLGGMIYV